MSNHSVIYVRSSFKLEVENAEEAKQKKGQTIGEKRFSPFPGVDIQVGTSLI
jgi:hypothetical protein